MSNCDVVSLERDEPSHAERSSEYSSLADDIEDDTEASTTSDKSSVFDESTKVNLHATIQMQVKDATLNFQHRLESGRDKTLKKLIDFCNKQLEFDTRHARPSVGVKTQELRKVAYDDLRNTRISDFIDESTMEMDLIIDYSECPEVFWHFIHALSMRTAEGSEDGRGSSADEVLQVAIAHFVNAKSGFSKTFDKDFECLSTSLTMDQLNILVPTLIQILGDTYIVKFGDLSRLYSLANHRKRQAGLILLHITKAHGIKLTGFANQLSKLVHDLFLSCNIEGGAGGNYLLSSRDCEWAAAYLPLLLQHVLRGQYALLDIWPVLIKEEIKQSEMEEKEDLIPHLLFSVEQFLQHVDKANMGSEELAKTAEMFKEEFAKYKVELAEFKERHANGEQDDDTMTHDTEIIDDLDDEEETETSEKELDDDDKRLICSKVTELIQRIRRSPEQYSVEKDDEWIKAVIRHKKELGEMWEELANFVVEDHAIDEHKKVALEILYYMVAKVLDQDETYLRRLVDFLVNTTEILEEEECYLVVDSLICLLLQLEKGKHETKRWMVSPLLSALLKMAEEEVTSGADELWSSGADEDDLAVLKVGVLMLVLAPLDEVNDHLPRIYTIFKVVHDFYGKFVPFGRMIRLRIAREAIMGSEELAKTVENFREVNKVKLANLKDVIAERQKERARKNEEFWAQINSCIKERHANGEQDDGTIDSDEEMTEDSEDEEETETSEKILPESNLDLVEE